MAKRDPALPGTSVQELLIHQVYCIIRETAQHVCDRRPDLNVSAFEAELIRFVARIWLRGMTLPCTSRAGPPSRLLQSDDHAVMDHP
jgi:hypothetical protein